MTLLQRPEVCSLDETSPSFLLSRLKRTLSWRKGSKCCCSRMKTSRQGLTRTLLSPGREFWLLMLLMMLHFPLAFIMRKCEVSICQALGVQLDYENQGRPVLQDSEPRATQESAYIHKIPLLGGWVTRSHPEVDST